MTAPRANGRSAAPDQEHDPEVRRRELERAATFVRDRITKIRDDAALVPHAAPNSQLVVHVVPLGRDDAVIDDLADHRWDFLHSDAYVLAQAGDGPVERFNRDGYHLQYTNAASQYAFVQFLRNGGVEYGTNHILEAVDNTWVIDGGKVYEVFRRTLPSLLSAVHGVRGIAPPLAVFVTLIGFDGMRLTMHDQWVNSVHAGAIVSRIDGSHTTAPALILEEVPVEWSRLVPLLQPLADRTWQCAGFPQAPRLR